MSDLGEPWTLVESRMGFCHMLYDANGRLVCQTEGNGGKDAVRELTIARRIKDSLNALAGLDPGDVATLVGLVRRYRARHNDGACMCVDCEDANALLARLPK
jgi:hypothetical protein